MIRAVSSFTFAIAAMMILPAFAAPEDHGRAIGARLPEDYSALRERPLFAPDRRGPVPFAPPPVVEPPPPPPSPEPEPLPVVQPEAAPPWQLIGVVRAPGNNSALFRDDFSTTIFTLRQGEDRDGWTLAEVDRFEVALDSTHARAFIRFPDAR